MQKHHYFIVFVLWLELLLQSQAVQTCSKEGHFCLVMNVNNVVFPRARVKITSVIVYQKALHHLLFEGRCDSWNAQVLRGTKEDKSNSLQPSLAI